MPGRSPSTEPVKMSRPPSPITRAAARAPRKAAVRFTSSTSRQTAGSVSRGPATIGEIPALPIQTSTPPHSATVASATASLNASSATSPAAHERRPGQLGGDVLQVGLGAGHERHAGAGLREPVREQPAEAPAGAGEHHPLAPDVAAAREGRRDLDLFAHLAPGLVPTSTIGRHGLRRRPARDAPADAGHPRLRAAGGRAVPIGRGARASCTCRSGRRRRPWGPAGRSRPADVITSTHRGHGHCLAKGLDPLGMFAELMARDEGTNRGRGGSMHIADPNLGHLRGQRDRRRRRCRSRWARRPPPSCAATAASRSPSSATARWPRARSTRR